jgi:hypothetical protein
MLCENYINVNFFLQNKQNLPCSVEYFDENHILCIIRQSKKNKA